MKSRRNFLKTSFFSSSILVMSGQSMFAAVSPLQTLKLVQTDLFPKKRIEESNAYAYIGFIFRHAHVSDEEKRFLRNGTKWLNEKAVRIYDEVYTKLETQQRQAVLESIAQESWGKAWIKRVLGYIMEAVLGDPIYGVNKQESGWDWLNHESGLPRPKEALV